MSAENDLALAYHMGYDDALAKRKPDASKAQVLAPYDLAAENAKLREEFTKMDQWHSAELIAALDENAKLRELVKIAIKHCDSGTCDGCPIMNKDESCPYSDMAHELGVEVTDGY